MDRRRRRRPPRRRSSSNSIGSGDGIMDGDEFLMHNNNNNNNNDNNNGMSDGDILFEMEDEAERQRDRVEAIMRGESDSDSYIDDGDDDDDDDDDDGDDYDDGEDEDPLDILLNQIEGLNGKVLREDPDTGNVRSMYLRWGQELFLADRHRQSSVAKRIAELLEYDSFIDHSEVFSQLEELLLVGCRHVVFRDFATLKQLELSSCRGLTAIPSEICHLESLKTLSIVGCDNLSSLPAEIGHLEQLEELRLDNNEHLEVLPSEIFSDGLSHSLQKLEIDDCPRIRSFPVKLYQLRQLQELVLTSLHGFRGFPVVNSLQTRRRRSETTTSFSDSEGDDDSSCFLPNLTRLRICDCDRLERIPLRFRQCSRLDEIELYDLHRDVVTKFFSVPWGSLSSPTAVRIREGYRSELESHSLGARTDDGTFYYSKLLGGIPNSLQELALTGHHGIDDLSGFLLCERHQNRQADRGEGLSSRRSLLPRNLERLLLDGNPILNMPNDDNENVNRTHLQRLLEKSLRLRSLCSPPKNDRTLPLMTPRLFHMLLWNRCGRILLTCGERQIPLSVWPTVLEQVPRKVASQYDDDDYDYNDDDYDDDDDSTRSRTRKECHAMQFSVVYAMLQGPAFAGRPPMLGFKKRKRKKRSKTRTISNDGGGKRAEECILRAI